MTRTARAAAGATPRTEYPPFGNQASRAEWTQRLAEVTSLRTALDLLIDWRDARSPKPRRNKRNMIGIVIHNSQSFIRSRRSYPRHAN